VKFARNACFVTSFAGFVKVFCLWVDNLGFFSRFWAVLTLIWKTARLNLQAPQRMQACFAAYSELLFRITP
jgi:hypothetical protein